MLAAAGVGLLVSVLALPVLIWIGNDGASGYAPDPGARTEITTQRDRQAGRVLEHVTISDPRLDKIGFTVSLPAHTPHRRMPVVFALGALGTGLHSISLVHAPGSNVLVGYDWPSIPPKMGVGDFFSLRKQAVTIPAQMTAVSQWVLAQRWADSNRVTVAGFSLGAIAAPAVEHALVARGVHVRWTVLADGGAPISAVLAGDQAIREPWLRGTAAVLAKILLRPVDPARYVSQLSGNFLLISSAADTTIPAAASNRLAELTPNPKKIVRLPGGHVGTSGAKRVLLDAAVDVARRWLITERAINTPVQEKRVKPASIG